MSQYLKQLRCLFYLVFSLEGIGSNAIFTCLLLKFVSPIFSVRVEEAIEEALSAGQKAVLVTPQC